MTNKKVLKAITFNNKEYYFSNHCLSTCSYFFGSSVCLINQHLNILYAYPVCSKFLVDAGCQNNVRKKNIHNEKIRKYHLFPIEHEKICMRGLPGGSHGRQSILIVQSILSRSFFFRDSWHARTELFSRKFPCSVACMIWCGVTPPVNILNEGRNKKELMRNFRRGLASQIVFIEIEFETKKCVLHSVVHILIYFFARYTFYTFFLVVVLWLMTWRVYNVKAVRRSKGASFVHPPFLILTFPIVAPMQISVDGSIDEYIFWLRFDWWGGEYFIRMFQDTSKKPDSDCILLGECPCSLWLHAHSCEATKMYIFMSAVKDKEQKNQKNPLRGMFVIPIEKFCSFRIHLANKKDRFLDFLVLCQQQKRTTRNLSGG